MSSLELDGDYGTIPSVLVTCRACGESVEVFGTSDNSIKRGCVMLRKQCGSSNFYVHSEE
jgi:hypothetical protein